MFSKPVAQGRANEVRQDEGSAFEIERMGETGDAAKTGFCNHRDRERLAGISDLGAQGSCSAIGHLAGDRRKSLRLHPWSLRLRQVDTALRRRRLRQPD